MKFKLGLLLGTGIGYLVGSGKAQGLLRQAKSQALGDRTGGLGATGITVARADVPMTAPFSAGSPVSTS